MDRRQASIIIPEIYKATVDADHWDHVLELLANVTGSESALLYFHDKSLNVANRVAYYGCIGEIFPDFSEQFSRLDSLFDQVTGDSVKDQVLSQIFLKNNDSAPDIHIDWNLSNLKGDADYHIDWNLNNLSGDTAYHLGRFKFIDDDKYKAAVALLRDETKGGWGKGDIRVINEIVPHLQRALDIHSEFSRLRLQQDVLLQGLDRLVIGIILYDENARAIYLNPTAISIIENHPALSLGDNGLVLKNSDDNRNLHQTILDTSHVDPEDSWKQSVAIGVTHPDVEAPLPLLVTPLHASNLAANLDYEGAKVAVFLSDPSQPQPISVANLVSVYSLTPSEARVAISIANGQSIFDIAGLANISAHTVRTQLKAIFRKTGVNRQNELIKLLLTGPFAHRRRFNRA